MFLFVHKWDSNNKITRVNHFDTLDKAKDMAEKIGGFAVEDEKFGSYGVEFLTVNSDLKTVTYDEDAYNKNTAKEAALLKIFKLEGEITPRRLRDSVLTSDGKTWLEDQEKLIAVERAKL